MEGVISKIDFMNRFEKQEWESGVASLKYIIHNLKQSYFEATRDLLSHIQRATKSPWRCERAPFDGIVHSWYNWEYRVHQICWADQTKELRQPHSSVNEVQNLQHRIWWGDVAKDLESRARHNCSSCFQRKIACGISSWNIWNRSWTPTRWTTCKKGFCPYPTPTPRLSSSFQTMEARLEVCWKQQKNWKRHQIFMKQMWKG